VLKCSTVKFVGAWDGRKASEVWDRSSLDTFSARTRQLCDHAAPPPVTHGTATPADCLYGLFHAQLWQP